jgi:CubicO group peptidase (beta-lactamase class C family)
MAHDLFDGLRERVREAMGRLHVPGVAFGVIADGQTTVDGLGVTNVEHPLPVTADTLFQIGSISKTITGTAAVRLAQQGLLELDAPVRRYIPDLKLQDADAAERVTMRHLLTHTTSWQGDYFLDTGWGDDALARYVARMGELQQLAPLGSLWSYCNSGFCLAGRVIEIVTGKPAEEAITELVFAPLGMDQAFYMPAEVMTHRFVVGHRSGDSGATVLRPWPIPRAHSAVGGVSTSVTQLLRYADFHLHGGPVLSDEYRALMQVPQYEAGNFADQVGLTWMLREMGGLRLVAHGGATNGQMAQFTLVPSHGFALALLTNGSQGGALNTEIVAWALKQFLGVPPTKSTYLTLPVDRLSEYVGTYTSVLDDVELRIGETGLVAQTIPRGGFPTVDSPAPPAPPPARLAFTSEDRLVVLDPPTKDSRAEVLRDPSGAITWLRSGGRAHRRVR